MKKSPEKRANHLDQSHAAGCPFVTDQLHAYVEGEVDRSTTSFVLAHLEQCEPCRVKKDKIERDRLEFLESFVVAPKLPDRFATKVVAAIHEQENGQKRRALLLRRRFSFGLAAGLLLGAAIFGIVFWTLQKSETLLTPNESITGNFDSSRAEIALPKTANDEPEAPAYKKVVTPVSTPELASSEQSKPVEKTTSVTEPSYAKSFTLESGRNQGQGHQPTSSPHFEEVYGVPPCWGYIDNPVVLSFAVNRSAQANNGPSHDDDFCHNFEDDCCERGDCI